MTSKYFQKCPTSLIIKTYTLKLRRYSISHESEWLSFGKHMTSAGEAVGKEELFLSLGRGINW